MRLCCVAALPEADYSAVAGDQRTHVGGMHQLVR